MNIKLSMIATGLISVLILTGCQTPLKSTALNQSIEEPPITLVPDIPDSDGDGVLDDIDECPETSKHTVVDVKGCTVVIEGGEALEMEFSGFFPSMSSQLPNIYDIEFGKIEEKLSEYPEATVFIFGHVASSEIDEDVLANFGFESLPRHRALIVKNMLVLEHGIATARIHTYDCSNKLLVNDNAYIDPNFKALNLKNIESKQRRVALMASSEVSDLKNLDYISYQRKYGKYAKHCDPFE
ncbi:hypothetical protein ACTXGL_02960 [Psychrobacter sp. T6-6]|uniref:hypothetical protein n=1 Tax=Psychrobacter sp. T6-6 TaxID=3457452 RepID=UPI003FD2D659